MSQAKRILVGQSGGPTSAINASLAGVIAGAREKGVRAIGMRYGIQGFLDGRTVDLDQAVPDDDALALLRDTPASWLGSCRFKLPEPEADPGFFARALERIDFILRQQSDEFGCPYIDVKAPMVHLMQQNRQREWQIQLFTTGSHLSELGNLLVADTVFEQLKEREW